MSLPLTMPLRALWRTMRRQPSYVIATVAAIALGVGASTTVFTLVDAVLLRPLPIPAAGELVNVHRTRPDGSTFHSFSVRDWQGLRRGGDRVVDLAAFTGVGASLRAASAGGHAELIGCQVVSANYLDVLGVRPMLGRGFSPADDSAGAAPVALLSFTAWQRRFGGDPAIVGRQIWLASKPFTVAGVLPAGFRGHFVGFSFDVWVPLGAAPVLVGADALERPEGFELIGRRTGGASLERVRGALAVSLASLVADRPEQKGDGVDVRVATPVDDSLRGAVTLFLGALLAIAGLVLAIAVVNIAGLLLARGEGRRREMAVRRALGGGTGDLARLVLFESVGLCLLGGGLGLGVAAFASRLFAQFNLTSALQLELDLRPDVRVALFALAVAILAGLGAGLAPALQARGLDLATALREAAATLAGRARLRSVFVGAQAALALVLIVMAGLFARAIGHAGEAAPAGDLTVAEILWPVVGQDDAAGARFYERLLERAGSLPGVSSASLARRLPFGPERALAVVTRFEDGASVDGHTPPVDTNVVAPGYFTTLGWPLLAGRDISPVDGPQAPAVAVVSASLARRLWSTESALGREIWVGGATGRAAEAPRRATVVGVAPDVVFGGAARRATVYLPLAQNFSGRLTLLLRGGALGAGETSAVSSLGRPLAEIAAELEPDLPTPSVMPFSRALAGVLLPQRLAAATAAGLGAVGLLLALGGVYAVVAYGVARRRRELAIRVAVGAQPGDLARMILREQGRLGLRSSAAGLLLSVFAGWSVRGLLLGVSVLDPLTLIGGTALLLAVVLLASLPGALRAAAIDPARLLRSE
ncbi:MAG: ADOP family duplicated permease [Acidobacteriota bacterium]